MILTLDKGLDTERSIEVDTVSEKPIAWTLTASRFSNLKEDESFPELDDFGTASNFTTVDVTNDGKKFPISGKYNTILDYSVQYSDINRRFSVSLMLGWVENYEQ